jgi:hypothetical protein
VWDFEKFGNAKHLKILDSTIPPLGTINVNGLYIFAKFEGDVGYHMATTRRIKPLK